MKLAFFDLDHTLMINPFVARVFPYIGDRVARAADGRVTAEEIVDELTRESGRLRDLGELRSHDWDAVTRDVAARHGVEWHEPVAEIVVRNRDAARVVPGSEDALRRARSDGWTVIGASQGFRRFQEPIVEHLGLDRWLPTRTYSDDVGTLKRTLAFYGEVPRDATAAVVIGDSYVDDAVYPKWFGFATVWFTGVARDEPVDCGVTPDWEIADLAELPGILASIERDPALRSRLRQLRTGPACARCGIPGAGESGLCRVCACVTGDGASASGRRSPAIVPE